MAAISMKWAAQMRLVDNMQWSGSQLSRPASNWGPLCDLASSISLSISRISNQSIGEPGKPIKGELVICISTLSAEPAERPTSGVALAAELVGCLIN